jgi:hypothetical protein
LTLELSTDDKQQVVEPVEPVADVTVLNVYRRRRGDDDTPPAA